MPEGDTVYLSATRLRAALRDEQLTKSDFRVPALATIDLSGRAVEDVVPRGKHLLFRIQGGLTLHTHYKMDGSWHLYRHGERWRGPQFEVRAVLKNRSRVAVGFRLAIVQLIETKHEVQVVGHLGPDPLGEDWDAARVVASLRAHPDEEIGALLLDQRIVAGPGNVYKSEVCFLAGVDPQTPAGKVADLDRLVDLLARLMLANRTTGTQITTGDLRPGRQRWVYGRAEQPCFRCGTRIRRREQDGFGGDRVTFWCPTCQPVAPASIARTTSTAMREG
ncbi:MAG: DNA glycosylase [Actinomycetota bacterium]|nr:DNA glycosylase [Actinomycetota bacterium]